MTDIFLVEDDIYVKDPDFPHEDNWVWSPQGEIAMHLPERWGFLQFSEAPPNTTNVTVVGAEWTLRQGAMAVYYAQQKYALENGGQFTEDVFALVNYLSYPVEDEGVLLGECMAIPIIDLG